MAIILEAAYSKKLGLPNYSSHSFVVSIRTELADLTQVESESARLYTLLQSSVDQEIQAVGFLPEANTYGLSQPAAPNGNGNGHAVQPTPAQAASSDVWACSDKQKELVLSLVEQHRLDKKAVEALAKELFSVPVKTLNKLQASGLIEELLQRHGGKQNGNGGKGRRSGHGHPRRSQPAHA